MYIKTGILRSTLRGKNSPSPGLDWVNIAVCFLPLVWTSDFHLDSKKQYEGQTKQKIKPKRFYVRVGGQVQLPCPIFSKESAFYVVYWKYCSSETCDAYDTTWSWMAGMSSKGIIKVIDTGKRCVIIQQNYNVPYLFIYLFICLAK